MPTRTRFNVARNFYPRSPCGERQPPKPLRPQPNNISIHALLAESDFYATCPMVQRGIFLSTLSLRRATSGPLQSRYSLTHFYPRSPCGERRRTIWYKHRSFEISIHALLAESDIMTLIMCRKGIISIHALLAESDPSIAPNQNIHEIFLSTLSLRRATGCTGKQPRPTTISIHALLAESDGWEGWMLMRDLRANFYPRSPCGERQGFSGLHLHPSQKFLSTLSLRRATMPQSYIQLFLIFLSTLSLRRATFLTAS